MPGTWSGPEIWSRLRNNLGEAVEASSNATKNVLDSSVKVVTKIAGQKDAVRAVEGTSAGTRETWQTFHKTPVLGAVSTPIGEATKKLEGLTPALNASKDVIEGAGKRTGMGTRDALEGGEKAVVSTLNTTDGKVQEACQNAWDGMLKPAVRVTQSFTRDTLNLPANAIGGAAGKSMEYFRAVTSSASATGEALQSGVKAMGPALQASAGLTSDAMQVMAEETWDVVRALQNPAGSAELSAAWSQFNYLSSSTAWPEWMEDGEGEVEGPDGERKRSIRPPPVGDRCPLLGSRQFVTDMARLSEQLVMDDMMTDYWPDEREAAAMAAAAALEAKAVEEAARGRPGLQRAEVAALEKWLGELNGAVNGMSATALERRVERMRTRLRCRG